MPTPSVALLGTGGIRSLEGWISWMPEKRLQLLAFLAYAGDWVARERLVFLFWPDYDEHAARRNLRKTLHKLRRLPWLAGIEVEVGRVRWLVPTDVAEFRQALADENWSSAVELYRGPLMAPLDGAAESEFASWLCIERERVHSQWRDAVFEHVRQLVAAGRYDDGHRHLKTLLRHDPLDEEAVRLLLSVAGAAGRADQAHKLYEEFRQTLAVELGIEPSLATQKIAESFVRVTEPDPLSGSAAVSQGTTAQEAHDALPLPSQAASAFVGRDEELSELARLLAQPDCRLLTLVGAGGAGKSRLAWHAAQSMAPHYRDGCTFVALEAVSSPTLFPTKLAEALEVALSPRGEPFAQVAGHLAGKECLLVLDNFEQLTDASSLVPQLLRRCPSAKVLVTSRVRLDLEEEWLLPVGGLSFPQEPLPLDQAVRYDAVKLFVQRARRVKPGFRIGDEELAGIVEICRLVEGLPLGLELSAVWVRLLSCSEIAREIQGNLDFLASSSRNRAPRHQSVRATFEHSWKLLTVAEQEALTGLSVFRGGFSLEAAKFVADASLSLLASLVDKSLLRPGPSGRYDRHPLLVQYTREKLAEHRDRLAEAKEKHAAYYRHLVSDLQRQQGVSVSAVELFDEELENILIAWRWTVKEGGGREIERFAQALAWYYEVRARSREGSRCLAEAIAALEAQSGRQRRTLGYLWAWRAWLEHWSDSAAAAEGARRALALLRPLKEQQGIAAALRVLGLSAWLKGDYGEAERCYQEGLRISEGLPLYRAIHLDGLGLNLAHRGAYDEALACYREAMAINEASGNAYQLVHNLVNLASVARRTEDLEQGLAFASRALELATATGFEHYLPYCLTELGWISQCMSDHPAAADFCRRALELARHTGDTYIRCKALTILAISAAEVGELTEASAYVQEGIATAWRVRDYMLVMQLLCAAASIDVRCGELARAATLAQLIRTHPASPHWCVTAVEALMAQIEPQLSHPPHVQAATEAVPLELEAAVTQVGRPCGTGA